MEKEEKKQVLADDLDRIDRLDDEIMEKLERRMALAREVAETRQELGKSPLDPTRVRERIEEVTEKADDELEVYSRLFYTSMAEFSRDYQIKYTEGDTDVVKMIKASRENTPKVFPESAKVACQGVFGAYSQEACDKIFKRPRILYKGSFDQVFSAIERGECRYGILPLENSTAGSVNQVYDLMTKYDFHIVRSTKIKVDHSLLVKPGTAKADIKAIYSHEQALMQCENYLLDFPDAEIKVFENTAEAAKMVAESDRKDIAAIASRECGSLYGLEELDGQIQDSGANYTRFICIGKDAEIYPGSSRTSLMLSVPHRPGSLYHVLAIFYALGINMVKLESRPIPDRDFDFMFYFDLDSDVYSESFIRLMNQVQSLSEDFRYLGSYVEVA